MEHDLDTAVRLVNALSWWWALRGRLAGQVPLLRDLAGRAEPGSEGWCAAQFWLAWAAVDAADLAEALHRCAATVDVIGDRLRATTGRFADAITAWAADEALAQQTGIVYADTKVLRREDALRQARQALGPDRAQAADQRGAAMSMVTAAEYALQLTAPDVPPSQAAGKGKLSARERELVTLVACGRTDADIAAQLYISIRAAPVSAGGP